MTFSLGISHKQSGFTLIELMVVMAIIAILATAGLSAYTGYIKKARDTTRIADINAINTIVLGAMSVTGMPPQTALEVYNLVKDTNNGTVLMDPLATNNGLTRKSVCLGAGNTYTQAECGYTFRTCDGGLGYSIGTRFESISNWQLYGEDNMTIIPNCTNCTTSTFEIGSCKNYCYYYPPGTSGCSVVSGWINATATSIDSSGVNVIGFTSE